MVSGDVRFSVRPSVTGTLSRIYYYYSIARCLIFFRTNICNGGKVCCQGWRQRGTRCSQREFTQSYNYNILLPSRQSVVCATQMSGTNNTLTARDKS